MHFSVQNFREEKGLTQLELAKRSGVSQSSISLIEKGERAPTVFVAKRIADALEMTVDELIVV